MAMPDDDRFASALRGFGPVGILAMLSIFLTGNVFAGDMVVLPVGAALILLWRWRSHTPWSAIGYVRPRNWTITIASGIICGVAFKLLMKTMVMPLLGAPVVNHAYHFLAGNRALIPAAIWAMLVAGFAEETAFHGFLFERMEKFFGSGIPAKTSIVLLTSVWFGLEHYTVQGLPGVEQATITGLVFGSIFAVTGRLFVLMIAHASFDLTAYAIIYFDLESRVGHLVFR